jgi:hypothetical protein
MNRFAARVQVAADAIVIGVMGGHAAAWLAAQSWLLG